MYMSVQFFFSSSDKGDRLSDPQCSKELLTRNTICSICILTICNFSVISRFGFWVGLWFRLLQVLVITYLLLVSKKNVRQ